MSKKWLIRSLSLNLVFTLALGLFIVNKGGFKQVIGKLIEPTDSLVKLSARQHSHWQHFESHPTTPDSVVFLGDSLTELGHWGEYLPNIKVFNRGISGLTAKQLSAKADFLLTLKAKELFLMIGINDIWKKVSNEELTASLTLIFEKLSMNKTLGKVTIFSILPVYLFELKHKKNDILSINSSIKLLARKSNFQFVDLHSHFVNQEGFLDKSYSYDGVHLNALGYKKWLAELSL